MLDHQHGIQFMVWPSYGWDSNHVSFFFCGFIVALLTLLGNPGYHIDKWNPRRLGWWWCCWWWGKSLHRSFWYSVHFWDVNYGVPRRDDLKRSSRGCTSGTWVVPPSVNPTVGLGKICKRHTYLKPNAGNSPRRLLHCSCAAQANTPWVWMWLHKHSSLAAEALLQRRWDPRLNDGVGTPW